MCESCPICLEEIKKTKLQVNCSHYFHRECITLWLKNSSTCPLCRKEIEIDDLSHTEKLIVSFFTTVCVMVFFMLPMVADRIGELSKTYTFWAGFFLQFSVTMVCCYKISSSDKKNKNKG